MSPEKSTYSVEIAGVKRELTLFEIKPGLRIAILNILGDTELVEACAKELGKKLSSTKYDIFITAETKSIPLAHALSVETKKAVCNPAEIVQTVHGQSAFCRNFIHYHRATTDTLPR